MTADPLFVARLLQDAGILKAAIVHDFIPLDAPLLYLGSKARRMRYLAALAWLRNYDLFLPISEPTRCRLDELFGTRRSVVTGVALPAWARPGENAMPRHILAIAGDDHRKNPEAVIRAHGASRVLQSRKIPLIVTGNYRPASQAQFRDFAQSAGGDTELLLMPGHVSNETLCSQVQNAICVVTASRAEGFSLPVIEAMAAGVPSIVSDIPAHAELVIDMELRFDPDDSARLIGILERIVLEPAYRAAIIAKQASIWPAFEARTVAAKIWSAIQQRKIPDKVSIGGAKPRIAMLSPFPPMRSGVADYSAASIEALSAHADLVLFSATKNLPPVAGHGIAPLSEWPHLCRSFDRVISVLGNSHFHSEIYDLLMRYGGAAICHDSRLLHFYAHKNGLKSAARLAGEELQRAVSEAELAHWQRDETQREASLLSEVARHAQPLIFHAKASVDLVRHRFGTNARYLPFALQRSFPASMLDAASKQAAKRRLGLDPSKIHIASFGFLSRGKGLGVALEAVQILNGSGISVHLHWVGDADALDPPVLAQADAFGLSRNFHIAGGYLSEVQYRDYLLAADYGLQLRNTGAGSISGALQDCIAAGLQTIANASLADALGRAILCRSRPPTRWMPAKLPVC